MGKNMLDLLRLVFPLPKEKRMLVQRIQRHLSKKEAKDLAYLVKEKKLDVQEKRRPVSSLVFQHFSYPEVLPMAEGKEIKSYADAFNRRIHQTIVAHMFRQFSKHALEKITKIIAPHIYGFDYIKEAIALQLFAKDRFHILLLGDPGTGKTELIRFANVLGPISSFGLGSGTTGAGLSITVQGKEITKGLLPMAHEGICCIDELNLMKKEDTGSLYNAMEKGFVTYDKGSTHIRYDAEVRILATANPKGDTIGNSVAAIKKQLPFSPALLSRFHLVYVLHKPSTEAFLGITKQILHKHKSNLDGEDQLFIQEYIKFSEKIDVEFDSSLEPMISTFMEQLKKDESSFVVEVNPRLVVGIMHMAKARARAFLRTTTKKEDVQAALDLVELALYRKEKKN